MIGDQAWWSNRDPGDSVEQAATRLPADDEPRPLTKAEVLDHLREQAKNRKARDHGGQGDLIEKANHWRDEQG